MKIDQYFLVEQSVEATNYNKALKCVLIKLILSNRTVTVQ